jgi:hypothetical protein
MVKVAAGFVEVRGSSVGGEPLLLGPAQQSIVPTDGVPQAPQAMELDPEESEVVNAMLAELPQPDLGPPDPAGSPTMSRIRERDQIEVVTDETVLTDGVDPFATSLVTELSRAWDLGPPDVFPADRESAIEAVTAGDVDVFLTPDPPEGLASIAAFADPTGRLWFVTFVDDPSFGDGLTRFLTGVMTIGTFGELYVASFGSQPSYDQLGSLLGF